MTPAEIVAWSDAKEDAGKRDAMGQPFTSWLLALRRPDGQFVRDQLGDQIFETHAEFKGRQSFASEPTETNQNMELFS